MIFIDFFFLCRLLAHKCRFIESIAFILHNISPHKISIDLLNKIRNLTDNLSGVDDELYRKCCVYLLFDISLWYRSGYFAVPYQLIYEIIPNYMDISRNWIMSAQVPFGITSLTGISFFT